MIRLKFHERLMVAVPFGAIPGALAVFGIYLAIDWLQEHDYFLYSYLVAAGVASFIIYAALELMENASNARRD